MAITIAELARALDARFWGDPQATLDRDAVEWAMVEYMERAHEEDAEKCVR